MKDQFKELGLNNTYLDENGPIITNRLRTFIPGNVLPPPHPGAAGENVFLRIEERKLMLAVVVKVYINRENSLLEGEKYISGSKPEKFKCFKIIGFDLL